MDDDTKITPFPFVACGAAQVDVVVRLVADYTAQPAGGVRVVRLRLPNGVTLTAGLLAGQEEHIRSECLKDLSQQRLELVRRHRKAKGDD